jgi:hypothetical protein
MFDALDLKFNSFLRVRPHLTSYIEFTLLRICCEISITMTYRETKHTFHMYL